MYDNKNVKLLLNPCYSKLSTEEQISIFGTIALQLALAASSARAGDIDDVDDRIVDAADDIKKVDCPALMELLIAVDKYAKSLEPDFPDC